MIAGGNSEEGAGKEENDFLRCEGALGPVEAHDLHRERRKVEQATTNVHDNQAAQEDRPDK